MSHGKRLSPEERELINRLKSKRELTFKKAVIISAGMVLLALVIYIGGHAGNTPANGVPYFEDCVTLTSPLAPELDKLKILTRYLPERPRCTLKTGVVDAVNVFQPGTQPRVLHLHLNQYHSYEMDGADIAAILFPDAKEIPAGPVSDTALRVLDAYNDFSNGNIDIAQAISILRDSGQLAGYAGENAQRLKVALAELRQNGGVPADTIPAPVWLDAIASLRDLKPKIDSRAAASATDNPVAGLLPQPGKPLIPANFSFLQIFDWLRAVGKTGKHDQ